MLVEGNGARISRSDWNGNTSVAANDGREQCSLRGHAAPGAGGNTYCTGCLTPEAARRQWKVVLVLPDVNALPTKATRAIAIMMPNDESVYYDWTKYRVSVDEVEKLAGLKFWPLIPEETAKGLKEKVDEVKVHVPRPKKE